MKILTASKAVSLTNLRSQVEQKGCHALELFICCSRASLFANCLLSHWGQTGIVLQRLGRNTKDERQEVTEKSIKMIRGGGMINLTGR